MNSNSFVMEIELKIVINGMTQRTKTAKVTIQVTNECQTTSFDFKENTVFPSIYHKAADTGSVST